MKRKTIKKIASLLALTLTATAALAGCGKKDEQTNTNASSEAGSSVESGETADSDGEVVEKTGKLKIMVADRGNIPFEEGDLNDNRWTTWIRENAPVAEIEFVPITRSEAFEGICLQFASGDGPDAYTNNDARLTEFVNQGIALEITDEMLDKVPNYKKILEAYPALRKNNSRDGKLYSFGSYSSYSHNVNIIVRQDWMENLGFDVPKTPEELYDMIYAFTYNDPDGNGIDDTYGISMVGGNVAIAQMFGWDKKHFYGFNEDGEFYFVWDRIEDYLNFAKKIVEDKLCHADFMTMKGDDEKALFVSGKIGLSVGGWAEYGSDWDSLKENLPDAKFTTFPLPETEYGKFSMTGNSGISSNAFISTLAENVDSVLAYYNWAYQPEVADYLAYGPEGTYYERNEYGTWVAIPENAERRSIEYDYRRDYKVVGTPFLSEEAEAKGYSPRANDNYNRALSIGTDVATEAGIHVYKLWSVACEPGRIDPKVYLDQGMPALPEELALVSVTTEGLIMDAIEAGVGDKSKTAAQIVEECKKSWIDAGGETVDAWYAEYYNNNPAALYPEDFEDLKNQPEMTPVAKENALQFGFDPDKFDLYSIYQK